MSEQPKVDLTKIEEQDLPAITKLLAGLLASGHYTGHVTVGAPTDRYIKEDLCKAAMHAILAYRELKYELKQELTRRDQEESQLANDRNHWVY